MDDPNWQVKFNEARTRNAGRTFPAYEPPEVNQLSFNLITNPGKFVTYVLGFYATVIVVLFAARFVSNRKQKQE